MYLHVDMLLPLIFVFYALIEILYIHNYTYEVFIVLLISLVYMRVVAFVISFNSNVVEIRNKIDTICCKLSLIDNIQTCSNADDPDSDNSGQFRGNSGTDHEISHNDGQFLDK